MHLGQKDQIYKKDDASPITIRHMRRENSPAVLEYVAGELPELKRIVVSGASAGGVAARFYAA